MLLLDPRASGTHALVWLTPHGPELVAFGRNPTRINGMAVEGASPLASGDRVELPGETLTVQTSPAGPPSESVWIIAVTEERPWSVYREPIRIGGSTRDDLFVEAWPPTALVLSPFANSLAVQFEIEARCNGKEIEAGVVRQGKPGDGIEIGGTTLRILDLVDVVSTTQTQGADDTIEHVRFTFLPHGGELHLLWEAAEHRVRFPEIRARLVASLLTAPAGYEPGDWIPDEDLVTLVWPRMPGKGRTDVNTVLHRVRRDLLDAGVDAFALIERDMGATRFVLPSGVEPEVG